jgi:hypothetical protein
MNETGHDPVLLGYIRFFFRYKVFFSLSFCITKNLQFSCIQALFKKVGIWLGRATAAGDFDMSGQQAVIFIEQRVAQNDRAERFSIK